jgi:non-ribosomal peptide synthetase component F
VPLTAAAACLHELVEAQAKETPDVLAVVTSSARVSYGQLERRANALACELRDRGVGVETIVGLYLDRSVEALVAILGTLKAGGAYLSLDVRYPAARIQFCLEDSGAPVVVTRRSRRARLPVSGFDVIELDSPRERVLFLGGGRRRRVDRRAPAACGRAREVLVGAELGAR